MVEMGNSHPKMFLHISSDGATLISDEFSKKNVALSQILRQMTKTYLSLPLVLVLLQGIVLMGHSQSRCGSELDLSNIGTIDTAYRSTFRALLQEAPWVLDESNKTTSLTIPVAFHIVYNSPAENITDSQINSALRILNEDYNRTNPDAINTASNAYFVYWNPYVNAYQTGYSSYAAVATGVGIEFCLAGVTRTQTSYTSFTTSPTNYNGGTDVPLVKDLAPAFQSYPPDQYLNVWVCNLTDFIGYATFPNLAPPQYDGITVRYSALGDEGASGDFFKRTITHEVGHWLGLFHIWGNSGLCGDDLVSDTYPHERANNYQSPQPNNTALSWNLPDQTVCSDWYNCGINNGLPYVGMNDNFMDYAPGYCANFFSMGQSNRIWSIVQTYRSNLGSIGCGPVGIADYDAPFTEPYLNVYVDNGELVVGFSHSFKGPSTPSIIDMKGQVSKTFGTQNRISGKLMYRYDISGLSNGIYIFQQRGADHLLSKRFMVMGP